jgi:hypothetical protein
MKLKSDEVGPNLVRSDTGVAAAVPVGLHVPEESYSLLAGSEICGESRSLGEFDVR